MKKLTKGIALALVLSISVLAAGCANQEALNFYKNVQAANINHQSIQAAYVITRSSTVESSPLVLTSKETGTIEVVRKDNGWKDAKETFSVSFMDVEQGSATVYCKDGYAYYKDNSQNTYESGYMGIYDESFLYGDIGLGYYPYSEKVIKSAAISQLEDGNYQLDMLFDGAEILKQQDQYSGILSFLTDESQESFQANARSMSDVRYIITVDSQYRVVSQRCLYSIVYKTSMLESDMTMSYDVYYVNQSYNTISRIDFPKDLPAPKK